MEQERRVLARISIIVGLVGLIMIYISSLLLTPTTVKIRDITRQRTGQTVRIVGRIKEIDESDGTTFMTLKDSTGSIKGVKFSKTNISRGERVISQGEIDIYRGELEIIINKIERESA